jgi:hypothetical protein
MVSRLVGVVDVGDDAALAVDAAVAVGTAPGDDDVAD